MRVERNPWISIADLLSSVVLVLLLLFIMASIGPKYSKESYKAEMMKQINSALSDYEAKGRVKVHIQSGMLEFTSVTFPPGSAELSRETDALVKEIADKLKHYMKENRAMEILIEGHTDPSTVYNVQNIGGYYENNIQLSTLRAANVREALLHYLGQEYAGRIGVAGYGETRLKNKKNQLSAENRRIEIRLIWTGNKEK